VNDTAVIADRCLLLADLWERKEKWSMSNVNGPLPKSPFPWSKPFLTNLRLTPGDVKTRPSGFKQLTSLIFRFAKIYYQKRFNGRSKGFPFEQQPVKVHMGNVKGY
jgi:hypothetical protein